MVGTLHNLPDQRLVGGDQGKLPLRRHGEVTGLIGGDPVFQCDLQGRIGQRLGRNQNF